MTELTLATMPISTNQLYLGHKILTRKARDNKTAIGWEANAQFKRGLYDGPITVHVAMWWKDARNHDLDNLKALLDALTGVAWVDDKQIVALHITKGIDKLNQRCEVKIYEA